MTKQEIQELKASLSIREVIGRYTKLNRVGRRWMGLCPFHGDRHPSLSVNEEKGSFVCYACGERGDVFAFVSKIENVGFVEAANKLSIDSGQLAIEGKDNKEARLLPERLVIKEKKENSDAVQLPVVNSQLSIENEAFLALLLPAGSGCSELTPTWLDFGVGQSPCLVPERWKAMRNRLVFPVRDEEGRLAGFAARRLSDEDRDKPKYVNSETGGLYRKSELLYGLYEAREAIRREGSVFLVEGYKDVLAMHAAGFRHTVALCGTHCFVETIYDICPRDAGCRQGGAQGGGCGCPDACRRRDGGGEDRAAGRGRSGLALSPAGERGVCRLRP